MKKNMGKRISCAALAVQMLLPSAAQAAGPMERQAWVPSRLEGLEYQSGRDLSRLNLRNGERNFPRLTLRSVTGKSKTPAGRLLTTGVGTTASATAPQAGGTLVAAAVTTNTAGAPGRLVPSGGSADSLQSQTTTDIQETEAPAVEQEHELQPEAVNNSAAPATPEADVVPEEESAPGSDEKTNLDMEGGSTEETPSDVAALPPQGEEEGEKLSSSEETAPPADKASSDGETTSDISGEPEPLPSAAPELPPQEEPDLEEETEADTPTLSAEQDTSGISPYSGGPSGDNLCVFERIYTYFGFGPEYWDPHFTSPLDETDVKYLVEGDEWYQRAANAYFYHVENQENTFIPSTEVYFFIDFIASKPDSENSWMWDWANDERFLWDEVSQGTYLAPGVLPTKDDFPRLPNKEFSGQWYIYDSANTVPGSIDYGHVFKRPNSGGTTDAKSEENFVKNIVLPSYEGDYKSREYEAKVDSVLFDPSVPLETYLPHGGEFFLPIIAKWDLSGNATLIQFALREELGGESLSLYAVEDKNAAERYASLTADQLAGEARADLSQALSKGQKEFFLRVPEETDALTLDMLAYEPGSQVEIKAEYPGAEPTVYTSDQFDYEETAQYPENSVDNPARGKWVLKTGNTIPLHSSRADAKCNVVTITVTAPDGTSKEEYTIYVQRLAKARMELKPGNTPAGMIMRDPELSQEQKRDNLEKLMYDGKMDGLATGAVNNNGIYPGFYHPQAWGDWTNDESKNPDWDPGAIVAYQNTAFEEPGFVIYDALGDPHDGATGLDVQWSLELTCVDELKPECASDVVTGSPLLKNGTGNVDNVSLVGDNVKPGVYTLRYTYVDSYDRSSYAGDGFSRTVGVLPLRGDVDMDGAVTPADGVALQKLIDTGFFSDVWGFSSTDMTKYAYFYRVCNLNDESGVPSKVAQESVEKLLAGYDSVSQGSNNNSFYLPLPGGVEKDRTGALVSESGNASLGLEYLGMATDPDHPDVLDPEAKVNYSLNEDNVFWMGVKLKNAGALPDLLKGGLSSLTLTLAYDAACVAPYLPKDVGAWGDYILTQNPWLAGWTVHCGETGTTPRTHPGKAESVLSGTVKELRLTITPPTGAGPDLTQAADGMLLRVPFKTTSFPNGKEGTGASLVELTLGMRDLAITTTTGAATWNNGQVGQVLHSQTANLAELIDYRGSAMVPLGKDTTPIYRVYAQGTTDTNAKYGDLFESGSHAYNGDYEISIPRASDAGGVAPTVTGLPKGIRYDANLGTLSGTPEEAGVFTFYFEGRNIGHTPYQLEVDQAVLDITVQDVTKFYGETKTTEQIFTYNRNQIKAVDAGSNTGAMADLTGLMGEGYEAPKIDLVTNLTDLTAVTDTTVPGEYTVRIQGGKSKNYKFRFIQAAEKNTDHPEFGSAKLIVLPRPLLVDKLTTPYIDTLWETNSTHSGTVQLEHSKEKQSLQFVAQADRWLDGPTQLIDSNGYYFNYYNGSSTRVPIAPLTTTIDIVGKDQIELKVGYEAPQLESDKTDSEGRPHNGYILEKEVEERPAKVDVRAGGRMALTQGKGQNAYYTLVQDLPMDLNTKVKVRKVGMLKIEVVRKPGTSFPYGQKLYLDNLLLEVYTEDRGLGEGASVQYGHTVEECEKGGLTLQWVSKDGEIPSEDSPKAVMDEKLSVEFHNGKYLCISGIGTEDGGVPRVWVGPFTVGKQKITLTIEEKTRYYGEEIPEEDWVVRYDHSQLVSWDQDEFPETTGLITDLAGLPGYKAPSVLPLVDLAAEEAVTAGTDVGTYYVKLFGAASANYDFEYTYNTGSGRLETRGDFGLAPFTIIPRPILVTKINSVAGALFHDSESYVISNAAASLGNGKEEFSAQLPQAGTTYYSPNGMWYEVEEGCSLTGRPVLFGDMVTVTYRAEVRPDNGWHPWFDMGELEYKQQHTDITRLQLQTTGKGKNYHLIFPNTDAMGNGWAGEKKEDSVTQTDIFRRRILDFEILSAPTKTSYNYGETLTLDGLQLRIRYAGANGEPDKEEIVRYYEEWIDGVWNTALTKRGLKISWGVSGGQSAANDQQLFVATHSGVHLVITGPEYPGETALVREVSTPITVRKGKLTLTPKDMTRKYGEENGRYEFTFDASQLARWDKPLVEALALEGSATALNKAAVSPALAALNAPYEDGNPKNRLVGPRFITQADRTSPVRETPYSLRMAGGSMANYEFELAAGGITVEKRPIMVRDILKDILYTVAEGTPPTQEQTTICYQGTLGDESYDELQLATRTVDGLTGDALLEGDGIAVRMKLKYDVTTWPGFAADEYEKDVPVIAWGFTLAGGDSGNYELVEVATQAHPRPAMGRVHRRDIASISVAQLPRKLTYTYGEELDLSGLLLRITYTDGTEATVSPEKMNEIYVDYWDGEEALPAKETLENWIGVHAAATGDHLTIAKDDQGFAHHGKYLMLFARTHASRPFVEPILSGRPIIVEPLELQYTLSAEDKPYDHNREGKGAITLTNVYPGDRLWVKNGTDYETEALPADHTFRSDEVYGNGVTFTFVDENVKYRTTDAAQHIFEEPSPITVEVTNIVLDGPDSDNYAINFQVLEDTDQLPGRDSAPSAVISPIRREAPDLKTELWVDEHTNTVIVTPQLPVSQFSDGADRWNDQLHYEYALVYWVEDEEGNQNWTQTEYQDSPYFGGEQVLLDGAAGGQTLVEGDLDFGTRNALIRGTYMGALVRLAQTNNYEPSQGTASFRDHDADGVIADTEELQAAFRAAVDAVEKTVLPEPEEKDERIPERIRGSVIKTYSNRIDLVYVTETQDGEGKKNFIPVLDQVWFTDVVNYENSEIMDRLVGNRKTPKRYSGYYWDLTMNTGVRFPLDLSAPFEVELPVKKEDGSTEQVATLVNKDAAARFYVTRSKSGGGSFVMPETITIVPGDLELKVGDDPVELKAIILPAETSVKSVTWKSSDESVAKVSAVGVVTAVAPGTAIITARAANGMTAKIEVRVIEEEAPLPPEIPYSETMFNAGYTGAFMELNGGRFEPERNLPRRELTVIMAHFFQMVDTERKPGVPGKYLDIPPGASYLEQVETLDKWGIVNGVGDGLYAPERPATRAEMSVILCRMLELPLETDPNTPHAFFDARPENCWAWAYIDALAKAGITNGTGEGYYNPNRLLTRAETATFMSRILVTKLDKEAENLIVPTDVTSKHWAYEYILRAINSNAIFLYPDTEKAEKAEKNL